MKFTENTVVGEVLDYDPSLGEFFVEMGMHCLGCPSSRAETIGEACAVHGEDPEALIARLNAAAGE